VAPRLGLALGPAPTRAGPACTWVWTIMNLSQKLFNSFLLARRIQFQYENLSGSLLLVRNNAVELVNNTSWAFGLGVEWGFRSVRSWMQVMQSHLYRTRPLAWVDPYAGYQWSELKCVQVFSRALNSNRAIMFVNLTLLNFSLKQSPKQSSAPVSLANGVNETNVPTRVAESEPEVFGWSWIPNNTGSPSQIFLSDSGCPFGSFFKSHS